MNMESRNTLKRSGNRQIVCSVCGNRFQIEQSQNPPFCSERCKMVDLGRWMNEEIGMPHEGGPTKGEAVEFGEASEMGDASEQGDFYG